MANRNIHRLIGGALCIAATIISAASAPVQQKDTPLIGDYSLDAAKDIGILQKPNGDVEVTLVSGGTSPVQLHSPNYDISAGHAFIVVSRIRAQGEQERAKATRMDITGKVRIVNRNPSNKQKTIITSNSATYVATSSVSDKGTIRLLGNVRSEIQGVPSAASPFVATGDTGTIKFLPDGSLSVQLSSDSNNASFKGQIYEPAPKGKQP